MLYTLIKFFLILGVESSTATCYTRQLNDGNQIPILSFGTFGVVGDIYQIKPAVISAIETGYRQIDTASFYQNEGVVGEAIADVISRGIVTREDLWITTKVDVNVTDRDGVVPATKKTLERLQLDYIDLYLIHVPYNPFLPEYNYLEIWKGMEDAKSLGMARSIGVSNFNSTEINKLLLYTETIPAVNQIEVNPSFTNQELVAYCQNLNITVLAYAPFGFAVPRPFRKVDPPPPAFDDPLIVKIGKKYNKSSNQIFIRNLIDRFIIPIPKSTNVTHIMSNYDVFDFKLTQEEIYMMNDFDKNIKIYDFNNLSEWYGYFGL